jgi:mono/diheme cytochrome c family protein
MQAKSENSSMAGLKAWLRRHHPWPLWAFILIVAVLVFLARSAHGAGIARTKILAEGQQEYEENCVACHGADGKGGGELAGKLLKPPKDLTAISAANGGTFPFWRVFDILAGETPVEGHDTMHMPEYFKRMKQQDYKPGYLPAHVRILELTHYVESLQGK